MPRPRQGGGKRGGFSLQGSPITPAAWGEAGNGANQGSSRISAEQLATVVATFFESYVSREILGGDRAGPWLEVFAQVVSAGAAGVGDRAGGAPGWRERQRGAGLLRSARTERGDWAGGAGVVAEPSPTPHPSLQKSLPLPGLGFPFLKCGHPPACLSRNNRSICQSSSGTKAQGTSREWMLLIWGGGGRSFARFGALSCWERR